jgi:branched-chain amino acid transport system ATP-binding protein
VATDHADRGDLVDEDEPLLEAENVRVQYRNGALGVVDVSFRMRAGQVVALFGPNGAGKTTSVRAISGFLRTEGARVVQGSVRIGGRDVTNSEPHNQANLGVSLVPERDKVFPQLTVTENLFASGRLPKGERRAELLDRVMSLFPVLGERSKDLAGGLSGGQRQMLALGRAILSDPRILIVDEMTLGLHHSLQPPLFDAIRYVVGTGVSVLVVDESTGFALEVADHCYMLSAGRIVASGPAEDFRGNELLAAGYVEHS